MAARGPVLNVFRTIAQEPEAAKAFLAWGGYILSKRNGLAPREREIAILRTGYLCRSGYEWTQHVRIGLDARADRGRGGGDQGRPVRSELERAGPADPAGVGRALPRQVRLATPTWAALGRTLSQKQLMDLVFTVGQYTQVSMFLNSFGVQLDPGQTLDPDLKGF